jgi:hypothetical protein
VAVVAAAVAMASVPFLPIGGPVLIAALVAIVVGAVSRGGGRLATVPDPAVGEDL